MTSHNYVSRFLSLVYCIVSFVEVGLYWPGSPFYTLGFRDPLIAFWALVMLGISVGFLATSIYFFVAETNEGTGKILVVMALLFTLLNFIPALFYFNLGFTWSRILLHLAPTVLLFPLAKAVTQRQQV